MKPEAEEQSALWCALELGALLPKLSVTGMREGLEVGNTPNSNHFLPPAEALFNLLDILKSCGELLGHLLCDKAAVWWVGVGY